MRIGILITFFTILLPLSQLAQTIEGVVTDSETGEPLKGATVKIKNSNKGQATDDSGEFRLNFARQGVYTLTFSYLGYEKVQKEITLDKDKFVEVGLQPLIYPMEEVMVSSSRTEINRMNIPMTISAISEEEIEQSVEKNILPVISRKVPGVFVNRRGVAGYGVGRGAAGQISIRGTGGTPTRQVLVLVDGQPQMMGIFSHPFSDNYVSSDLQKVEVIRGPASVIYGSNAMGGVINLITEEPDRKGFSGEAGGQYGTFNTQKYKASMTYSSPKLAVTASFNHDETDGHRPNSAFRIDNGFGKVAYQFSDHFSATANLRITDFTFNDPGRLNDTTQLDGSVYRRNFSMNLKNQFDGIEGGLMLFHNYGDHALSDGWNSKDENYGFSLYQRMSLYESADINVGLDFKKYGGKGSPVFPPRLSGQWFEVSEKSAYAILHQNVTKKLLLNAGLRLENHSEYGEEWVPQFGLNYRLNPSVTLRAMASKGFRNPSIQELYLFPPANRDLQPETMWNYEAGARTVLLNGRLEGDLAIFYSAGANIIQQDPLDNPPPPVRNMNAGEFSRYGLDMHWQFAVSQNLQLFANYSHISNDDELLGVPGHMASGGATYKHGEFRFHLDGQYAAGLYLNKNPQRKEEWMVVNVRAANRLTDYAEIFVSAENLLDTDYQMMYGYPMPGISLTGGLNVKW